MYIYIYIYILLIYVYCKYIYICMYITGICKIEGSFEVKLPTIWTDGKAEVGRVKEEKSRIERRSEKRKSEKKEDAGARKGRRVAIHVFFQWFVAPEGQKVGSQKRRVRSYVVRWEMKSCTPLWREAYFQVKMSKAHQHRTTFGSWDVEKVLSTCPGQNVENTPRSDHFWKLTCRKSALPCGTKHISTFGSWHVEKMARSSFPSQNVKHTTCSDHFWRFRCVGVAGARYSTPCQKWAKKKWGFCSNFSYNHKYTTLHLNLQLQLHYITLHYTTLH